MSSVFAVNTDKNLAVVKESGQYVLIDTQETDVISTSATFSVPEGTGWQLNPTDRTFPETWTELAQAATSTFAVKETQSVNTNKVFRVPKKVQEENLGPQSVMTLAEIHEFSNSDAYAFTPDVPNTVEWVEKILKMHPNKQGALVASGFTIEDGVTYFGVPVSSEEPFALNSLLSLDADQNWSVRVPGDWEGIAGPPSDDVVMLDPDSAELLAEWVDNPDAQDDNALEFSNIYPNEFGLFASAEAELDTDLLDRMFDIYDPYERSVNAQKQVRGTGGKFAPNPGAGEATPQAPKARLAVSLPLIPNIAERISQYLDQIDEQRKAQGTPAPAGKQTPPIVDKNKQMSLVERVAAKKAELSWQDRVWDYYDKIGEISFAVSADSAGVATTEVRPLYIAIVDSIDTDAVLDLVALVPPKAGTQGDVSSWKRAAGKWISAPEILQQLRGSTPPACVELSDENTLKNLVDQVDKSTQEDAVDEAPPAPGQTEVDPDTGVATEPAPVAASAALVAALNPLVAKGSIEVSEELFADAVDSGVAVKVGVRDDGANLYDLNPTAPDDEFAFVVEDETFNWVERVGGLPQYIKRIAKHLKEKGMDESHAIATAVNVVKKACATGDINYPGVQHENSGSQAEACAAVSEWEAKKAAASIDGEPEAMFSANEWREANGFTPIVIRGSQDMFDRIRLVELAQKTSLKKDSRDKASDKGEAMPDGSFPIKNKEDLKKAIKAHGRAKDKAKAKRHIIKRARALKATDLIPDEWSKSYAARGFAFSDGSLLILDAEDVKACVGESCNNEQQLHVIKRARALNRLDLIPEDWKPERDYYALEIDLWGPYGELLPVVAAGGLDRNRGNAERLRHYWTFGPGGGKIGWGTGGDWTRCVAHLSKYLGARARGYCALRHKEMNGYWPGDRRNK